MGDDGMEFCKIDESFFDQDPKFTVKDGYMSLDDAKQIVLADTDGNLGFCAVADNPDHTYCYVVKLGTAKYDSPGCGMECYVYKKTMPDDVDLYEDDFAEDEWKRPGRGEGLCDGYRQLSLFAGVDPNDLHQGGLGDCWLISAMATLAEFPDELMALFDRKTLSEDGKYVVTLYSYADGQMVPIEIDDRLPVEWDGSPKMCHLSESGEIWPCILEKAFAKYSEGYDEIDGGTSEFAFGAFTGCTDLAMYIRHEDDKWWICEPAYQSNKVHDNTGASVKGEQSDKDMLAELAEYDSKNYLMCCGSHQGSDEDTNASGIVQGHAYSLITVKQNVAGTEYDLLCLRNPWGDTEWEGDWSDKSELWDDHPEVAAECGHTVDEDGMFWISFEDFCENYKSVYVCKKSMSSPPRGKQTLQVNKRDIELGSIDERPHKVSPGIEKNRVKNQGKSSSCMLC
eukprot:TRINITY_DN121567_c0_g1_i1.p1 TRINITY_DN121567_c0_g1~~TRINITY_DN121567_c0_g1_i1.p1  ORF type:complete len:453 (-),score=94.08 TRINITY_DN121567_c0_g1_i1:257-1615(-)